jgi:hypothetical protein
MGKIKSFDIYFRFYLKLPTSLMGILIYFHQDNWAVGINFGTVRYKRGKNNTNSYLYNDKPLRVFVLINPPGRNPLVYICLIAKKKPLNSFPSCFLVNFFQVDVPFCPGCPDLTVYYQTVLSWPSCPNQEKLSSFECLNFLLGFLFW